MYMYMYRKDLKVDFSAVFFPIKMHLYFINTKKYLIRNLCSSKSWTFNKDLFMRCINPFVKKCNQIKNISSRRDYVRLC